MTESEFLAENQQMVLDLIQAVNAHEQIRGMHGAGMGALMDARYVAAHSVMSKLSRELGARLQGRDLDAMVEQYKDLPEHITFDLPIAISC